MGKHKFKAINFYRTVLLVAALLYVIFAALYSYLPGAQDPVPLLYRILSISGFLMLLGLSFSSKWVQHRLEKFTYLVSVMALVQLIYVSYLTAYNVEIAINLIVTVGVINLIFPGDFFALSTNILLLLAVSGSLLQLRDTEIIRFSFFFSYLIIAGFTYFLSYKKTEANKKILINEERYRTIFQSAPMGIMIFDQSGNILEVNKSLSKLTNYSKKELKGNNIFETIIPSENRERAEADISRVFQGEDFEVTIPNRKKDGGFLPIHLKETNITLPDGGKGILSMQVDISERFEKEMVIKQLHKTALKLMALDDIDKVCELTVNAAENLLDFSFCSVSLAEGNYLIPRASSSDVENDAVTPISEGVAGKVYREGKSCIDNDISETPEAKAIQDTYKSGLSIPIKDLGVFQAVSTELEAFSQEDLELAELLISHTTAALERINSQKELRYKTFHDILTDLYNRTFFEEEIKRLDTERQLPISIIMADINGLKIINDSFGHKKGDELIVKTAEILKESVRKEDILARWAGDEFVILLPQTGAEEAQMILERIKEKCNDTEDDEIPISLGLGEATKTEIEQDLSEILKQADNIMYRHKLLESKSAKSKIVKSLVNSLGAKSFETQEHAMRMSSLAQDLGEEIGLSISELNRLALLAILHDIGKTSLPEELLTKSGELTEEEWQLIKEHPERGYKIALASEEFALVAEEILCHHERWDGGGYPKGLQGEDIPYLARIISIVDAYDVMTSGRPYRKAVSQEEALAEISNCSGSQFDPVLAQKFVEMLAD